MTDHAKGLGTGASLSKTQNKRIGNNLKKLVSFLIVYALILSVIGWWWSLPPRDNLVLDLPENPVVGYRTTAAVKGIADVLMYKQASFKGGYISNDLNPLFPGLYIDNIKNWEFGALLQLRDSSEYLRNQFSRSQSQSEENRNLAVADPQFKYQNNKWILPSTEKEYKKGIKELNVYLQDLQQADKPYAQFFTRADNLQRYFEEVSTRLGNFSQKLSNSTGRSTINIDTAGTAGAEQATPTPKTVKDKTHWTEIDDYFYESQGYCWALIQVLKGIEQDFGSVLDKKNARISLQQIINDLEATQVTIWSPVILNGDGFGLFANHSLVMANYISRANAAVIDLRDLLKNG